MWGAVVEYVQDIVVRSVWSTLGVPGDGLNVFKDVTDIGCSREGSDVRGAGLRSTRSVAAQSSGDAHVAEERHVQCTLLMFRLELRERGCGGEFEGTLLRYANRCGTTDV